MPNEDDGGSSLVLWIVGGIGCLGLLCAGGLGAAVALPAFMKYMKRSKSGEAERVMSTIAEAAEQYYEANGTFPGSAGTEIKTVPSPPESGERYRLEAAESEETRKLRRALNFPSPGEKLYFQYIYSVTGSGDDLEAMIRAQADFDPSSEKVHTVNQTLGLENGDVQISQPFTMNEFE